MKTNKRAKFTAIITSLLLSFMVIVPAQLIAAQPTVNLGTTSTFAVLAGSGITNTGATTISGDAGGDIGVSPSATFTGAGSVTTTGATHLDDAAAATAQIDLVTAYNDAAARVTDTTIAAALGGGQTLTPGTYTSASSIQVNDILTLDAQGDPNAVFVFQAGSTLTTATNSEIRLINGARYCRVFWQVGTSATLGTNSKFVGHIFAMQSITATTGAAVQGQLLARNGAVTLDNNTITNGVCATVVPPVTATLNVIKHVINDNGRTAVAANFNLHVKTGGADVAASPAVGLEAPGRTYTLAPGDYAITEDADPRYIAIYSGDSDASGNITLAAGDNKTVMITNNDTPIPPSSGGGSYTPYPPLINVIKTPQPLALPSGSGLVTYTYKVTNPGMVSLSNVRVTDDKITTVTYVSGDLNADNLLQTNETWTYTSKMNLTKTTTNTVIAKGSANGMTATDVAYATVAVTPTVPPLINVIKTPQPLALLSGSGLVTYTYKITNPGTVALSNVLITDDKVSPVRYISGDINADNLLQTNETWIYTSKANLTETTTNTVIAKGSANGMTATDIAYATVVVTPKAGVTETVTGGQIPNTATHLYEMLIIGTILMLMSVVVWRKNKRYE